MNHPVLTAIAAIHAAFDEIADVEPLFMSAGEKRSALVEMTRLRARADALQMSVLAASGEVAAETGARTTAAWLAHETRDRPGEVRSAAQLGKALDRRWHHVAQTLAAGRITTAQARVLVQALDALPSDLGDGLAAKAETHLVEQAAQFGPRELARLGERVLEAVAPELAEAAEYQRLLAEEDRHREGIRLTFRRRGDGATEGYFRLPDSVANRWRTYLDGYISPRSKRLGEVDDLPLAQRRGLAFVALLENMPADGLPRQGGSATTISVTIDHQQLLADLAAAGIATMGTGDRITAGEARRLACQAGILPHVMGGRSVVLDQGRKRRFHDDNQRAAIRLVHDSCAEVNCDIPVAWTEIHHPVPWSQGGRTDLSGVPLCTYHHSFAHHPRWAARYLADGKVAFHRRQ